MKEFVSKRFKCSKKRKSLRVKMMKQLITQFMEDFLFEELPINFKAQLENKIKDTFSFKCEIVKWKVVNNEIVCEFDIEKENGKTTILYFHLTSPIFKRCKNTEEKKTVANTPIGKMEEKKIVVTTPTGKEVEMLSEKEYFNKYTQGSRVSNPMPHDYNNWTLFLLKDTSIYETLSVEDKIFIMEQQYEQYTSLWRE